MVHREEPPLALIPLKQREIRHPEKIVTPGRNEIVLVSKLQSESAKGGKDRPLGPTHDQQEVLRTGAGRLEEAHDAVITEHFLCRRSNTIRGLFEPQHSGNTKGFDVFR